MERELTFRERLVIEDWELTNKITKLEEFINKNIMFKKLALRMRMLMKVQLFYMKGYERMLCKRMNFLEINEEERKDIIDKYTAPVNKEKKETKEKKVTKTPKTKKNA